VSFGEKVDLLCTVLLTIFTATYVALTYKLLRASILSAALSESSFPVEFNVISLNLDAIRLFNLGSSCWVKGANLRWIDQQSRSCSLETHSSTTDPPPYFLHRGETVTFSIPEHARQRSSPGWISVEYRIWEKSEWKLRSVPLESTQP
jgi:hypothetical protein